MTTTELFSFGTGIVGLLSAIAMGVYKFRRNASSMKNDIISTYEKRLELMEEDIEKMKNDLSEVRLLLEKSEAARLTAEQILQGRNPELEKFMTLTLQMLTDVHGAVMPQSVTKVDQ